jgi:hypothetical protein
MTFASEIDRAKRLAEAAEFDRNEQALAKQIDDLCPPPELAPSDPELLQSWLAWCKEAGVRHAPARSWCVAVFILDRHKRGVTEQQIVSELEAIGRLHDKWKLSNPVTGPAHMMLERIVSAPPPRSWNKEEQRSFWALPPTIKAAIARRERERETKIRQLQNEVADLKKQLKPDAAKPVEHKEKVS